jgi:SAM-dependent methyltransferase
MPDVALCKEGLAMEAKSHWEATYQQKRPMDVSWYAPHLDVSLQLLERAGLSRASRVIDVGAGASTLVDDLLDRGLEHLTVLDISGRALTVSKTRLGDRAKMVHWVEADITEATLPSHSYDLWHDRALFHFLTTVDQRFRYLKTMRDALTPLGQVILATFGLQGPPRCSGLEVARYSPETLQRELPEFKLVEALEDAHQTPFHTAQKFIYCCFQRV